MVQGLLTADMQTWNGLNVSVPIILCTLSVIGVELATLRNVA